MANNTTNPVVAFAVPPDPGYSDEVKKWIANNLDARYRAAKRELSHLASMREYLDVRDSIPTINRHRKIKIPFTFRSLQLVDAALKPFPDIKERTTIEIIKWMSQSLAWAE